MDIKRMFHERGMVYTAQRDTIARVLLSLHRHVDAEELHAIVARRHPRIGRATVYRTLQLLEKNGLIAARDFGEKRSLYENANQTHHDHLICLTCGRIVEFEESGIEALQHAVAEKYGFTPVSHRLQLYGHCQQCKTRRDTATDE